MCDLRASTLVAQVWHPRAIFRFTASSYIAVEQFWGRAARASWVRKNPDARLIFPQVLSAHALVRQKRTATQSSPLLNLWKW
jgi:hypothetical protein